MIHEELVALAMAVVLILFGISCGIYRICKKEYDLESDDVRDDP